MRIDNPHHPLHYIRQSIRELYRRTRDLPAGTKFRLSMADGTPVVCSILQWHSVPGVGTTLKYRVLKTNEIKVFSWMEPGDVVHVDPVDESRDGYDFYGIRSYTAMRTIASAARQERLRREESEMATRDLAIALAKSQKVSEILATELKKEIGDRKLSTVMRNATQKAARAARKSSK